MRSATLRTVVVLLAIIAMLIVGMSVQRAKMRARQLPGYTQSR